MSFGDKVWRQGLDDNIRKVMRNPYKVFGGEREYISGQIKFEVADI